VEQLSPLFGAGEPEALGIKNRVRLSDGTYFPHVVGRISA